MKLLMSNGKWIQETPSFLQLIRDLALYPPAEIWQEMSDVMRKGNLKYTWCIMYVPILHFSCRRKCNLVTFGPCSDCIGENT